MLNKDLQKVVEFIVEYRRPQEMKTLVEKSVNFVITPESLQNVKDVSQLQNRAFIEILVPKRNQKFQDSRSVVDWTQLYVR